jgi:hypothetical protein
MMRPACLQVVGGARAERWKFLRSPSSQVGLIEQREEDSLRAGDVSLLPDTLGIGRLVYRSQTTSVSAG